MIDIIIIIAIMVLTVVSFITAFDAFDSYHYSISKSVPISCFMIMVLLIGWLAISVNQEWRVEKKLTSQSITTNGVQLVTFVDDHEVYTFHLNNHFSRTFEDGTEFVLEKRDWGPYFGIWYVADKNDLVNLIVK